MYTCGEEENAVIQSPATYRRACKSAKSNTLNVILCPQEEEQKLQSMEYEQIINEIGELRDQNIALNNQEESNRQRIEDLNAALNNQEEEKRQ